MGHQISLLPLAETAPALAAREQRRAAAVIL